MLKSLIKISITSIFSNIFSSEKKRSKTKKVLFGLLGVYVVFAVFIMFANLFYTIAPQFILMDYQWLYFALAAILVTLISVFGSFTISQSLLYNSKDNDILLSMPIKTSDILLSRIFVLLIFNFVYTLAVFIPAGVVYAIFGKFTLVGFISFLILTALLPLFTVTVSVIFAFLLTFFSRNMKNKSLFSYLFAIIFLVAYMFLSFNLQTAINMLLTSASDISEIVRSYLSLFYFFGVAVSDSDFIGFLIFAAVAILPFIAVMAILSATFLRLVNNNFTGKNNPSQTLSTTQNSILFALYKKEFQRLISFPTYIMNTTIGGILAIILAIALLIKGETLLGGFLDFSQAKEIFPMLIATALGFCSGLNSTTVASISLEGSAINIIKSLPIDYRDFYNSKILLNLSVGIPPVILASVISCVGLNCKFIDSLIIILYPMAMQIFAAIVGLCINMHKFKFDWTNPVYPVKQSFSVLAEILLAMIISVIPAVTALVLPQEYDCSLICLIESFAVIGIDALVYKHIMKSGKKYFEIMS